MKRLRYEKQKNGTLSTGYLIARKKSVVGCILPDGVSFFLMDDSGTVLESGGAPNLDAVKKLVKAALVRHGVKFLDEVRETKKEKKHDQVD